MGISDYRIGEKKGGSEMIKRMAWLIVPVTLGVILALAQTEGTRANILDKSGTSLVLDKGLESGVAQGMEGFFWTKTKSGDRDYNTIIGRFRVSRVEAQRCWVTAEATNAGYAAKDFQWATFAVKLVAKAQSKPAPAQPSQTKSVPDQGGVPAGKSVEWYLDQANALLTQGNYARAKEFYLMVMKLDPQDTVASDKYAQCQRKLEYTDLEKQYDTYVSRGDRALAAGDRAGALSYFKKARETMPDKADELKERFKPFFEDMMPMVSIPAGEFQMGSNEGNFWEKPVHRVKISAFLLGRTEVTVGFWKTIMGKDPSGYIGLADDYPVLGISWNDVQSFISKLNIVTGKVYRLPTEAEWEYACRAGTTGDTYGNISDISRVEDVYSPYGYPVGQKAPNAFGLYDMLGNANEWCSDYFVYKHYSSRAETNPQGPRSGTKRAFRGGMRGVLGRNGVCASARDGRNPDEVASGFRLAMSK